jgi:hypothetical protein
MKTPSILIVEDDAVFRGLVEKHVAFGISSLLRIPLAARDGRQNYSQ